MNESQPRSLPSHDAPNLRITAAHFDNKVAAPTLQIVAGNVAYSPAYFAGLNVLGCAEQASIQIETFSSCTLICSGNRSSQRHCQLVLEDGFVQKFRHVLFRSGDLQE